MLYQQLSSDEQTALIHQIAEYRNTVLPRLVAYGKTVPQAEIPAIIQGADYLAYWPQYASFADKAHHATSSLHRIVYSLQYLMGILSDELSAEMTVNTPDGRRVIVLSQSQTLRRGRPTAAESEQRRRDEEAAARAQALAHLTGHAISTSDAAPVDTSRPSDTSRRKQDTEPDLFAAAVAEAVHSSSAESDKSDNAEQRASVDNPDDSSHSSYSSSIEAPVLASTFDLDPSSTLPRLRELRWAMSDILSTSVSELRDLYAVRATESNAAKNLLQQGASIAEMSGHTQAAKVAERRIVHILREVDAQMAWLYVMLTEVNRKWDNNILERRSSQLGIHSDKLISMLRPYALKAAGRTGAVDSVTLKSDWFDKTLDSCRKANDAAIAAATRDPEREKEFHRMDAYIRRKDGKPTEARLQKMREYRDRLREMGADEDSLAAYEVFINAVASSIQ